MKILTKEEEQAHYKYETLKHSRSQLCSRALQCDRQRRCPWRLSGPRTRHTGRVSRLETLPHHQPPHGANESLSGDKLGNICLYAYPLHSISSLARRVQLHSSGPPITKDKQLTHTLPSLQPSSPPTPHPGSTRSRAGPKRPTRTRRSGSARRLRLPRAPRSAWCSGARRTGTASWAGHGWRRWRSRWAW